MSDEGIVYRVGASDPTFQELDAAIEDAAITASEQDWVVPIWMIHERTGYAEVFRLVFADKVWIPDH